MRNTSPNATVASPRRGDGQLKSGGGDGALPRERHVPHSEAGLANSVRDDWVLVTDQTGHSELSE